MADRVLRDHSKACNHSEFYRFKVGYPELWCCRTADCPGGREVTIDYEAATAAIPDWILDELGGSFVPDAMTRLIVDAALPDLEV